VPTVDVSSLLGMSPTHYQKHCCAIFVPFGPGHIATTRTPVLLKCSGNWNKPLIYVV